MNTEFERQLPQQTARLWRFGLRLTRHQADAEDLLQRTYVRALERRRQWQEGSSLISWLFSIMHSIWMNELRSAQRRREGSFESDEQLEQASSADTDQGARSDPEYQFMCKQVVIAVNELPEAQRVALLLIAVEGLSYKEAAQVLDIPIGTVMSRLARGRLSVGQRFTHKDDKNASNSKASI
jgi:RNA polymerase sigma-70 factor, ECF subfamily